MTIEYNNGYLNSSKPDTTRANNYANLGFHWLIQIDANRFPDDLNARDHWQTVAAFRYFHECDVAFQMLKMTPNGDLYIMVRA